MNGTDSTKSHAYSWALLNLYLETQRDRAQGAITHMRLVTGGAVILILGATSATIIKLTVSFSEQDEKPSIYAIAIYIVVLVSSILIMLVIFFALHKLLCGFTSSILAGLEDKVRAVRSACKRTGMHPPEETEEVLKSLSRDAHSF